MRIYLRDPISAISHYIGAVFSVIAIFVVSMSKWLGYEVTTINLIAALVFSISMFGLYFSSGLYHSVVVSKEKLMVYRKLDHSMIYVLIAGSYTPFLLAMKNQKLGVGLCIIIWTLAFLGVILKIFFFNLPRLVSTLMYIGLGWLAVFFIGEISNILPHWALLWMIAGGVSYSIGGIVYIIKKPTFKLMNFHDIFHLFILFGTIAQFISVYYGILIYPQ